MEEYLSIARNMYFFMCHQDAQYYLNIIYDKIKHSNLSVTDEQYVRFLQLAALIEMYCKEYSKALQFCEYFGTIGKEKNDDRLLYSYNSMCAMTQFGMEPLENQITDYIEQCKSIARKWGDELAEYKPQIIKLMSDCNYWRDIYIDYYDRDVNEEMVETAERFGFKNILAYIYIYCFTADQETLQRAAKNKETLFHFARGVELATEIENYELLISAYTKNIVVFSRVGCYDYVADLLEKKAYAVSIENNLIRVVHAYNGLGYNASITEKYQKAEEYFSKSIEELLKLDYVEDEGKYQYWLDTLFMKYLLEAMMAVAEGRLEDGKQKFDQAEMIMNMDKEKRYFSYLLYVQEMAKYYDVIGEEGKRREILQQGIEFCDRLGYRLRSSLLMAELNKKYESGRKGFVLKRRVSNDEILESIGNLALRQKLEAGKRDISFLTIWQELLSKCKNADDVMPQTFKLLKNHFNFDGVFMVGIDDGVAKIQYKDCPIEEGIVDNVTHRVHRFNREDLEKIADYFRENRNAFLVNRTEKGFLEYRQLLEVIGLYQVVTLFAAPLYGNDGEFSGVLIGYVEMRKYAIPNRYLLKENDLVILKFASEQLHSALERLKYMELIQRMNGQLSDMAVTDQLTGLYNRQGFEKMVQHCECEEETKKAVIYIDLDNFKYYNDNFGHELGDYVLVRFSQVLKDAVYGTGYAVRYGGDEFVVVMDDKDVQFAKGVVEELIERLQADVVTAIQKRIGTQHIIPENKRLSCSIGIAECEACGSITEALNNADKALYHIKRTTKNGYAVWDEL